MERGARTAEDAGLAVAAASARASLAMQSTEGTSCGSVGRRAASLVLDLDYASSNESGSDESTNEDSDTTWESEDEKDADRSSSLDEKEKRSEEEATKLFERMKPALASDSEGCSEEELYEGTRTKNERDVQPPPIPIDFEITKDMEIFFVGTVCSYVDGAVVLQGETDCDALDEGTVLVLNDRTKLGRVEEVFGPVSQPYYHFRPVEGAPLPSSSAWNAGTSVYALRQSARFVRPEEISNKGCDASGLHDEELPPELAEQSDDEVEAMIKRSSSSKRRGRERNRKTDVERTSRLDADAYAAYHACLQAWQATHRPGVPPPPPPSSIDRRRG